MGRFAQADEVVAQLHGANLDGFTWTGYGTSTAQRDELIEGEILEAESLVEGFVQGSLTPLTQQIEVLSGAGTQQIRLSETPVVDVQEVRVQTDVLSEARVYAGSSLRLDRQLGLVSIKPGIFIAVTTPFTLGSPYWFPKGNQNIVAQYRSGFCAVGNNLALSSLIDDAGSDIATVTTDGSYAYFTCPKPFSSYKSDELLTARGAQVMLKNGVDVSSQWTMRSSRMLRCAIANYSATAKFVLAYVPYAIGSAVVKAAAAGILIRKGMQATPGSANGATSLSAGPFREDYGEFQYSGQVKQWLQDAQDLLRPYRRMRVR